MKIKIGKRIYTNTMYLTMSEQSCFDWKYYYLIKIFRDDS